MSFRQPKSKDYLLDKAWHSWIERHRQELESIGLPEEVYLSHGHWQDFLENGHLHWHGKDSTGFDFSQLSPPAVGALRRFLEREQGEANRVPPLLEWLRKRHQRGEVE